MADNTRIPPHDISAEEALIGSLLIDGSMIGEVSLSLVDFYHEPMRILFETCLALNERGSSINQITVASELDAQGKLEKCGGVAYLSHLISIVPSPLDAPDYADIVNRLSSHRNLINIGNKIAEMGFDTQGDIVKKLDDCDKMLLTERTRSAPPLLISPKDRANMMLDRYNEMANQAAPLALSTGLIDLDRHLGGGFYNGDFVVIGARPGMGKSTLLMQMANHIAKTKPVLIVSAEMPVASVTDRDVAQYTGVPINIIRAGKWDDNLHAKIFDAIGDISTRNVFFYWQPNITTGKILNVALSMQARYGLGAVFVDYMGLLADGQGKYDRGSYERTTAISHGLNQMKLTLNVPIISAHQLSRDLEQQDRKSNRRPKLSDLRDSGAIEQDADVVLFIYRDNYYDYENTDTTTEIIIAKQRQGVTGRIKLNYDTKHQLYRNLVEAKELF